MNNKMKQAICMCLALVLTGWMWQSCDDGETYAEQRERERDAIAAFLGRDVVIRSSDGEELIRVGQEELLAITSTYDAYVRENTASPFWLVNTNKLVKQLEGVDGLKTGFTQEAKSCITVTAKRGDIRLISVVMNEADSKIRNAESKQLIDYGFSLVSYVPIYEVHDIYENVEIKLASPKNVDLVFLEPVGSIQVKDQVVSIKEMQLKITASLPYEVHEKIGEVTIHFDDGTVIAADVGVNERVLPLTYFDLVLSSMASLLTN